MAVFAPASIGVIGLDSATAHPPGLKKSPNWCMYGDSILGGGNAVFTGVTLIGSPGGLVQVTGATLHGLNAGMPVYISNTVASGAETVYAGHFLVESRVDANSFTYRIPGVSGLPPAPASASIQVLNITSLNDRNFCNIASAQLGNPFGQIINCAVSGQTAAYLLQNIDQLLLVKNPKRVSVLCGVNDITNDATEAQVFASITGIVDRCVAAGAYVELYTMPPLGSTATGYTAARQATLIRVNDDLLDYYRVNNPNVSVVDAFAAVVDFSSATGNWLSTYTGDQKHPNAVGAIAIAAYAVTANTNFAPPSPKYARSFINRIQTDASSRQLQNGSVFTGSGGTLSGGVTGAIADTWTCTKTGTVTVVATATVTRTDGVGFDNTITCTLSANNDTVGLTGTSAHTFCSAGDYLTMETHLRGTGITALASVRAYIEIIADGNTYTIDAIRANGVAGTILTDFDWTLRTPIGRIPTNAASITAVRTQFLFTFNGAGGAVFKVGRTTIQRYNGLISYTA